MLLLSEPLTEEEAKAICALLNAEFSALAAPQSGKKEEEQQGDVAEGGWCRRCGCGNDSRGFAHLPTCSAAPSPPASKAEGE